MTEERQPITVYCYDPVTKIYTGTDHAPPDPLEEDNFLIPADSTVSAPPSPVDGTACVWSTETGWSQVEDHRGATLFSITDKSRATVRGVGPIPSGYTTITPNTDGDTWNGTAWVTPPPDMNVVKANAIAAVNSAAEVARQSYANAPAGLAMVYQEKAAEALRYQTDNAPDPANYPLLNAEVGITADTLAGVVQAVAAVRSVWLAAAVEIETLRMTAKVHILEAADVAAVTAIVTGIIWPQP